MGKHPRPPVLVVDDEEPIREALAMVLEDAGFPVCSAEDGVAALDVARAELPSLIVLDLMMPRMDGWTFCDVQRRDPELAQIPVLVVSAVNERDLRSVSNNVVGYLRKPFDVDALVEIVRKHAA